eukprot:1940230-Prymnesium_polylepis.1
MLAFLAKAPTGASLSATPQCGRWPGSRRDDLRRPPESGEQPPSPAVGERRPGDSAPAAGPPAASRDAEL